MWPGLAKVWLHRSCFWIHPQPRRRARPKRAVLIYRRNDRRPAFGCYGPLLEFDATSRAPVSFSFCLRPKNLFTSKQYRFCPDSTENFNPAIRGERLRSLSSPRGLVHGTYGHPHRYAAAPRAGARQSPRCSPQAPDCHICRLRRMSGS